MPEEQQPYVLEEPNTLRLNQNLFDQQPFLGTIQTLLLDPGVDTWRRYCVDPKYRTDSISFIRNETVRIAERLYLTVSQRPSYEVAEQQVLQNASIVWTRVIHALRGYPHWYEYITEERRNRAYQNDGAPVARYVREGIPTYAAWLAQRLQGQDPRLFGISQLFDSSIDLVNSRTRMHWESRRILPQ